MSAPLFGPDWIQKDPEFHAERYGKFLSAVENATNSSDEGIKQVRYFSFFLLFALSRFSSLVKYDAFVAWLGFSPAGKITLTSATDLFPVLEHDFHGPDFEASPGSMQDPSSWKDSQSVAYG